MAITCGESLSLPIGSVLITSNWVNGAECVRGYLKVSILADREIWWYIRTGSIE